MRIVTRVLLIAGFALLPLSSASAANIIVNGGFELLELRGVSLSLEEIFRQLTTEEKVPEKVEEKAEEKAEEL